MTKTITNVSKNIKRHRKARKLSQDKLSKLADVSQATIIKIESGGIQSPTIETLLKITKVLDAEVDDLIK